MSDSDPKREQMEYESKKHEIIGLLKQHAVPYENWGKGSAKTLDHLVKEVMEGETILEVRGSGELVRKLGITYVDIYHTGSDGKRFHLVEDRQVFKDGRERRRKLEGSIAEKLKAGEVPDQAMVNRAMAEELGIESAVPVVSKGADETVEDSPSFPGLTMEATKYHFSAELNAGQFKPEGYIERQKDKDNYFVWKEEI